MGRQQYEQMFAPGVIAVTCDDSVVPGAGSIQLARLFGIRIGASPSWFFVLFLMIYVLTGYFGQVLEGSDTEAFLVAVAAALLFFVSLVLHELGHALVARRQGIGISGIDLWFFGGIAKMTRDSESPGEEFKVAVAGPLATVAVVGICAAISAAAGRFDDFADAYLLSDTTTTPAVALLGWLAIINSILFVFNMVPAFPLDGGRMARALAWRVTGDKNKGTRFSARSGQGFAYLLIGFGAFLLFTSDPVNGLWFIVLGFFLGQAARGAVASTRFSERIEGVTVSDLMDDEPVTVPGDATVLRAQDEFFLRYRWPWFPVVDPAGRFLGVLRQERVDGAVTAGQPALEVCELVDAADDDLRIPRDTPLEALLMSEPLRRLGALMVVDTDDRLCGVVTSDQVRRALTAAATRLA
jgi:Zn-dependent protease